MLIDASTKLGLGVLTGGTESEAACGGGDDIYGSLHVVSIPGLCFSALLGMLLVFCSGLGKLKLLGSRAACVGCHVVMYPWKLHPKHTNGKFLGLPLLLLRGPSII